jgi:glutathione peroxidase
MKSVPTIAILLSVALVACKSGEAQGSAATGAASNGPSSAAATANASAALPAGTTVGALRMPNIYDLNARTLDGKEQPLSIYRGKVALVVNTASECGFTPQYTGLQALSESLKGKPFVLLGFPSNDFGAQEPGTDQEIAKFTTHDYGITFPLFSKSKVKGDGANPVFILLSKEKGEPKWNFHKYLVDKSGAVVAAYPSAIKPDDPGLRAEIDQLLAKN